MKKAHSHHRRVVQSMAVVALSLLLARIVAACKEMVVASQYGINEIIDSFLVALTVSTWLPIVLGSVGASVLVPKLVELRAHTHQVDEFNNELTGFAIQIGLLLALINFFLGPSMVELIAYGLSEKSLVLSKELCTSLTPVSFMIPWCSILAIRLQSKEKHGYAILESIPPLTILILVINIHDSTSDSPFLWGTIIGYLLQIIALYLILDRSLLLALKVSFKKVSPYWHKLHSALLTVALGQIILSIVLPADQYFASSVGDGGVATWGYANRLVSLAITLGGTAIARAALPVLSESISDGNLKLARAHALHWALGMLLLGILASTIGWFLSPTVVKILFERGAFGPNDTVIVSQVLQAALLQLPFCYSSMVLIQWASGRRLFRAIALTSIVSILVKLGTGFVFVKQHGVMGISYSTTCMYASLSLLLIILTLRDSKTQNLQPEHL